MTRTDGNIGMKIGPNVTKLIIHKMSILIIPMGSNNGLENAMNILTDKSGMALREKLREATAWVTKSISLIKSLPDNPYGSSDEEIAGEILRQIESRKKTK